MFDFARVSPSKMARKVVDRCAADLIGRQLRNRQDIYRHGRWRGAFSSSGNGWLSEVFSELYAACKKEQRPGCKQYEQPIIEVTRLLMQYTYGPENDFMVKNPDAARGGVFWNVDERYVRTDSVCHAMNAYINMLPHLGDGTLIAIQEPDLGYRLRTRTPASRQTEAWPADPTDDALEP